jgi:hypothetical protein
MVKKPLLTLKKVLIALSLVLVSIFFALNYSSNARSLTEIVGVYTFEPPYSTDPMDFDSKIHHISMASVFYPLVSNYDNTGPMGLIAKSWDVSDDFKTWTFTIDKAKKFSNGEAITPEVVYKSLLRVAYLLKLKKSLNGFFEYFVGFDSLNSLSGKWAGMDFDNEHVVLHLNKPIKNVLELISYGMYSIIHPSQFDSLTGKWINNRLAISSGAYVISHWDSEKIELTLRNDYPLIYSEQALNHLKQIRVSWSDDFRKKADLILANSDDNNYKKNYDYYGGTLSEICFFRCISWHVPGSVCHDIESRRLLRKSFYDAMEKNGYPVVKQFLPSVMGDVGVLDTDSDLKINDTDLLNYQKTIKFRKLVGVSEILNKVITDSIDSLSKIHKLSIGTIELNTDTYWHELEHKVAKPSVDFAVNVSGMYIEKAQEDIQFIFKSKEGILLPDINGKILKALDAEYVKPETINQLLWDQATVWPVAHFGTGFWAKKNKYNFTRINLLRSPTFFELIGFN